MGAINQANASMILAMRSKVKRTYLHENCFPQFKISTCRSKRCWCPPGSSRVGPVSRICYHVRLEIFFTIFCCRDYVVIDYDHYLCARGQMIAESRSSEITINTNPDTQKPRILTIKFIAIKTDKLQRIFLAKSRTYLFNAQDVHHKDFFLGHR